jgi:hypothetical protein
MSSSLPLSVTSLVHTLALSVGRDSPNLGTLSGRALVEQWLGARTHSSRNQTAYTQLGRLPFDQAGGFCRVRADDGKPAAFIQSALWA